MHVEIPRFSNYKQHKFQNMYEYNLIVLKIERYILLAMITHDNQSFSFLVIHETVLASFWGQTVIPAKNFQLLYEVEQNIVSQTKISVKISRKSIVW